MGTSGYARTSLDEAFAEAFAWAMSARSPTELTGIAAKMRYFIDDLLGRRDAWRSMASSTAYRDLSPVDRARFDATWDAMVRRWGFRDVDDYLR